MNCKECHWTCRQGRNCVHEVVTQPGEFPEPERPPMAGTGVVLGVVVGSALALLVLALWGAR